MHPFPIHLKQYGKGQGALLEYNDEEVRDMEACADERAD